MKYLIKEGWQLNPNEKIVKGITKAIARNDGMCPCVHEDDGDLHCPCQLYREKDKSRQVHCLLNDATIIVFNKSNKKIITLLIADEKLIDKYVKHSFCSKSELDKIYKCAQLNRRTKAHKDFFANFDYQMYHSKKEKILM